MHTYTLSCMFTSVPGFKSSVRRHTLPHVIIPTRHTLQNVIHPHGIHSKTSYTLTRHTFHTAYTPARPNFHTAYTPTCQTFPHIIHSYMAYTPTRPVTRHTLKRVIHSHTSYPQGIHSHMTYTRTRHTLPRVMHSHASCTPTWDCPCWKDAASITYVLVTVDTY